MHDDLTDRFNVRLPLVAQAVENIAAGLRPALDGAGIGYELDHKTLNSSQFVEQCASCGRHLDDPLTEFEGQLRCEVAVGTLDNVPPLVAIIGDEFTVISSGWSDFPEQLSQSLLLVCLVPEWAYPAGWSSRSDVPRVFSIAISVRPNLRIAAVRVEGDTAGQPTALILKGGGIKGLAYVGALQQLASEYDFQWFIGTSAGAIAAVLLAAGYTPDELKAILAKKDFRDFFDARWFAIPWNLAVHHGMYRADTFTEWLDDLLANKLKSFDRVRLSDLPHRVTVYASRRGRPLLKFDSEDNDADAAYAVRCSMSIPLVFMPQAEQGIRAFDGGLQNNYPVDTLLRDYPDTPFVGLYLGPETYQPVKQRWVIFDLLSIWTEASDADTIRRYKDQTVVIDPSPVSTLDFSLTDDEKAFLLASGKASAIGHLEPDSPAHARAVEERDQLRSQVVDGRARKQRRRKLWLVLICVIVAAAVYKLW